MSFREYALARRGHRTKRSLEFEHTRFIVYTLASANRGPGQPKLPPIEQFMPLETDPKEQVSKEVSRLKKQMKEALAQTAKW